MVPTLTENCRFGWPVAALPAALSGQKTDLAAASGAGNAIRPAVRHEVVKAVVLILEVDHGFLEGGWFGCHGSTITEPDVLVKYIFTKTFIENKRVNQG